LLIQFRIQFCQKSAALNQLSYAGVSHTKAAFSNLIKGCDDPISRATTQLTRSFAVG
jgi:hypothetical protein